MSSSSTIAAMWVRTRAHDAVRSFFIIVLAIAWLDWPVLSGAEAAGLNTGASQEMPLRLTMELRDGSRVIGVPAITNLPLRANFAKLDIVLNLVNTVEFKDDQETATVSCQNGDRIQGAIGLEAVELQTIFGRVKIPLHEVRRIAVLPGGKSKGGLVLHYSFDQDDGEVVKDRSGMGCDGKFIGAKWVANGKRGGGFTLTTPVGELVAGNPAALRVQDFTLAAWVKRASDTSPSTGPYPAFIFNYRNKGYALGAQPDGRLFINHPADNHNAAIQARLADTQFHHVTATKHGKTVVFYLDGERCAEVETSQQYEFDGVLTIGSIGDQKGYPFHGTMDEVMIFNRPLSAQEVKQLFQETQ